MIAFITPNALDDSGCDLDSPCSPLLFAPGRPVVLLGTGAMLRACLDGEQAPKAADWPRASRLAVGLEALCHIHHLARHSMRKWSLEAEEHPWVVDCVNAARVAANGGAAALREVRFAILRHTSDRAYLVADSGQLELQRGLLDEGEDEGAGGDADDGHGEGSNRAKLRRVLHDHADVRGGDESEDEVDDAAPLVMISSDFGELVIKDVALILLRALADMRLYEPVAVVANGANAATCARRARGFLDYLGLGDVPVAVGIDPSPQGSGQGHGPGSGSGSGPTVATTPAREASQRAFARGPRTRTAPSSHLCP